MTEPTQRQMTVEEILQRLHSAGMPTTVLIPEQEPEREHLDKWQVAIDASGEWGAGFNVDEVAAISADGSRAQWSTLLQPPQPQGQQLRDWLEAAWTEGYSYASQRPRGGVTGASAPQMAAANAMEDVVSDILRRIASTPPQHGVMVPVRVRQSDNGTWWAEVATSRREVFCESGDTPAEAVWKVQDAFNRWAQRFIAD